MIPFKTSVIKGAKVKSGEYRLKKYLMENYSSEVRPVMRDADKVDLKFEIAIQQLIQVVSVKHNYDYYYFLYSTIIS